MKRALLLFLCACGAPAAAPAQVDPCANVDVVDHHVEITVGPENRLTGHGRFELAHAGNVALDTKGLTVTSSSVPFRQEADRVCLAATAPTVDLAWTSTSKHVHFARDQVWAGYQTSAWMPTSQRPEVRATLKLTIHAPASWKVIASGARTAPNTFVLDRPSPPFLFAFAAGVFEEASLDVDGVRLHALGPSRAKLDAALATTAPMLRFFTSRLGPYPAKDYTQVYVHGDAAQEAAMMALLDESALDDLEDDWIFSHELAHEWFAWEVPCADFSDFWLNEGLSTFFVGAYKEHHAGRAAYEAERALWQKRSDKVTEALPIAFREPGRPESALQPRGITYSRGALVLAKLREELGDDVFWETLRRYVQNTRNARTRDLANAGPNLGPFFEKWVYSPAKP